MKKTLKKFFGRGRACVCAAGCGSIAVFLVLAFAALAPQCARGYTKMGNDRMLLMNNDTKARSAVAGQSYYDTDTTADTYWVHEGPDAPTRPSTAKPLLSGTNHVMYAKNGKMLWHLYNCRAGSAALIDSARNYIPWDSTALSILDGTTKPIPVNSSGVTAVGAVAMRNDVNSCIYSPVYDDGIGTIYFDAVNAYVADADIKLDLQISTNAINDVDISTLSNTSESNIWHSISFASFEVRGAVSCHDGGNLHLMSEAATNLVLASTEGGPGLFYRARAHLNYYGPIRFRIRRINDTGGTLDTAGIAIVDNVIASYPPMTAVLERYGKDYDTDLKGSEVLGCLGDFDNPLLAYNQDAVHPRAWVRFIRNDGATTESKVLNASFVYRWRYLDQVVTPWKTIAFDQSTMSSDTFSTSNLVGTAGLPLDNGVGDLEYFMTAKVDAPYYAPKDYACNIGYGANWSEAITAVTNRAYYADMTPAGGYDYFVRIRESVSPCEYVKLCTSVTTNLQTTATNALPKLEKVRMELVTTNTWRYCYYVPTNMVGETLSFHFEGKKLAVNPSNEFEYVSSEHVWKCELDSVPYLPYTSVAGEGCTQDVSLKLDDAATHLIIEFNDELLSYSVSHGTYQNFNAWTDALQGYRGNAHYTAETNGTQATGVSDTKVKHTANMHAWEPQGYTNPMWTEDFNTADVVSYPLYTPFDTQITPNHGWNAGHGQLVSGARVNTLEDDKEEISLQLEGRGQGYIALDRESSMPQGIGTVSFAARVAQEPRFDDFAVYTDGTALKNYAVSAKITMSRIYDANLNPPDISPAQPSVSLVARYRPKDGAYEFRVTRVGQTKLACVLYKWRQEAGRGMVAHMLASNVIANAGSELPGPGQAKVTTSNMLVPGKDEAVNSIWTSAYLFVFNKTANGPVYIECMLANKRTNLAIKENNDRDGQKKVLVFTDTDSPLLKGTYGVGSTDCNAGFGNISYHLPAGSTPEAGIIYEGTPASAEIPAGDWGYYADRWRQPASGEIGYGVGSLCAVMPSNQTVCLQFKGADGNWFDSGYTNVITSFTTNFYSFAPCVSPDYKVRLITGGNTYDDARTDVVVDNVEVTSWRAADYPELATTGSGAHSDQWVYMASTMEASAEINGPGTPSVGAAGTNGYAFAFSVPGTYTVIPQMDLVVDRILLVGGGGAGGWTLGGGGGGGGVLEYSYPDTVVLAKGSTNTVIVGGGGKNHYVKDNGSGNWKSGGDGGLSRIIFKDSLTNQSHDYTVKGGGGGGGWGKTPAAGFATGGGEAQGANNGYDGSRTAGTANQGNSGGRAYGDRAGGGGGASLEDDGKGQDGTVDKNGAGNGGDGRASDITGVIEYYGGGGGGGAGTGGAGTGGDRSPDSDAGGSGGKGGGGSGLNKAAQSRYETVDGKSIDGADGRGGGGGGGSNGGQPGTNAGGMGGSGTVILRLRNSSKVCTLQPARGSTMSATGLRSPYLADGLSMFSFNYVNANSNCVLWLQVCTNDVISGMSSMSAALTRTPPDDTRWKTIETFAFTNCTPAQLASGTCTKFMSLRSPYRGYMRLVVAPEVMQYAADNEGINRDAAYGQITVTGIYCYNEPALDMRSWWGWNLHTEGWNTPDKQYAYLFDSPEGLSASLNFSAKAVDNDVTIRDTRGIGLSNPESAVEYEANNSFVQCPPLTNGIGTVTFRARTFTTNQVNAANKPISSFVTLFGSSEPDSDQVQVPADWKYLASFEITNTTYQTFKWFTTDDSTKYYSVRLEVTGTRLGRAPGANAAEWEKPLPPQPTQRVWIDEITASEPIAPRIAFRDVRPFRSGLDETIDVKPIPNLGSNMNEQPILGESWGIQATVEAQQMSDELVTTSVVVYAAFYHGITPWGYSAWKDKVSAVRLEQVSTNTLTFRSTYNNASSIIGPDMTPSGRFPDSVWQYYVWAEYEDKNGVKHIHGLDSTEWAPPSWYYGIKDLNKVYGVAGLGEDFAGYTILDSISPQRAWLNEINVCDAGDRYDYTNQFVEIAVPQGADLSDWRLEVVDNNLRRGTIAVFGRGNASGIKLKTGGLRPNDFTNHYTFVALRSPCAMVAGTVNEADGAWEKTVEDVMDEAHKDESTNLQVYPDGAFYFYLPYGIALVRPSGVIEHQIVFQGTNYNAGSAFEWEYAGTNLLEKIKKADGDDSHWFYAGEDFSTTTLGVFKRHGETAECWSGDMRPTPAALNRMKDGTWQTIDADWFLQPNGTNVWIYANVIGLHVHQAVGINTNNAAVVIMRKGLSTNIVYTTDSWYQIGEVSTNGVSIAEARGRGSRREGHKWTLQLNNVQETLTVNVGDECDQMVLDAGLDASDAYYRAIMAWLTSLGSDADELYMAEQWDLGNRRVGTLDIKDMYWLDINPTQPGWVLKGGMGGVQGASITQSRIEPSRGGASLAAVSPMPTEDGLGAPVTNLIMRVTMMITNTVTGEAHAPYCIRGLEPDSRSDLFSGNNWTSATFKVCGALQKPDVKDLYYPLRWFVFGPESFENYEALIEVVDPHSKNSPGFFNGWNEFQDTPIFFRWKLNADPANFDTAEMLKADSTY